MAKLYRVELKSLKSWRSGKHRFVKGYPQTMSEEAAKPFMNDGHFSCTAIGSAAQEADKVSKGVVKEAPRAEQPRLADKPKEDQPREDLSASLKVKAKGKPKPEAEDEEA